MLGEPSPAEADREGVDYGFEFGATKTTGGRGFADVFKRGHFGWEYKGTRADMTAAFSQLQRYAVALDNPPLLIVSDVGTTIRIHTNWTNSVSKTYDIPIAELRNPEKRGWLKAAFTDPDALRPKQTRQELTEEVAGEFAYLARSLRERGHAPEPVAHFINRLVFCMFAEDVKLLPNSIFSQMIERSLEAPDEFTDFARQLFTSMRSKGGRIGFEKIAWFNGGLFDDDTVFALTRDEIRIVHKAAKHYWGDIDPAILGTLFERGLDPDKRSQLGAHYTDREKIMMIVDPVITGPLTAEWEAARTEIEGLIGKADQTKGSAGTRAYNQAQAVLDRFLQRLSGYRVLDPACGSGNFLYLALRALKDLEHRAQVEAEALGLPRTFPRIGPEAVLGIELNPYAAELARVSVWIGDIQWNIKNGFAAGENPILKPLHNIECRDALVSRVADASAAGDKWAAATWPRADAIIGNPPFLGGKRLRDALGDAEVERLFALYQGQVPAGADLVVYWVEKARQALISGRASRAGFVSTNSIRGGANRRVLDLVADDPGIITAWADEPWTVEGAAVRVSLLVFGASRSDEVHYLDGLPVARINADLSSTSYDLTKAATLRTNRRVAFQGPVLVGPFEVDGQKAREWLALALNPNGLPNSHVMRPLRNGKDINARPRELWVVDFHRMTKEEAALFQAPFEYLREHVQPVRARNSDRWRRENWWLHGRTGDELRAATTELDRYIAGSQVSKHRLWVWMHSRVHLLQQMTRAHEAGRDADRHLTAGRGWRGVPLGFRGLSRRGIGPAVLPAEAEIFSFRCILLPGLGILADHGAALGAHADAFDLPKDHRLTEELARISGRIPRLQPAHRLGGNAVACQMLGGLGRIVPQELAEIRALVAVELEMLGGDLDEAFQRMNARPGGEGVGQVFLRPTLLDQLGVAHALHVADAHEHGSGRIGTKCVNDLLADAAEHGRLHQHHALVVEPDAPVAQREVQDFSQVLECGRCARLQLAAGAATEDALGLPRGFRQRNQPISLLHDRSSSAQAYS